MHVSKYPKLMAHQIDYSNAEMFDFLLKYFVFYRDYQMRYKNWNYFPTGRMLVPVESFIIFRVKVLRWRREQWANYFKQKKNSYNSRIWASTICFPWKGFITNRLCIGGPNKRNWEVWEKCKEQTTSCNGKFAWRRRYCKPRKILTS